jgi:hypothetical protein
MLNQIKLLIVDSLSGNEEVFAVIFNEQDNRTLDFSDFLIIEDIYQKIRRRQYSFNGSLLNYYEFRSEIEKLGFKTILEGLDSFFKYYDDFISQVKVFRQSDDIIKEKILTQLKEIIQNNTKLEKYPNLNNIIKIKDRDNVQQWMETAMRITLDNANTMNYVNNFILNGLTHNELLLCDRSSMV